MQVMKRIAILSTLLVFLLGNIGLSIYTHSCKMEGVETSYFIQLADPCEEIHQPVEHSAPCCKEQKQDSGCCSTDAEYVQLNVDLNLDNYQPSLFILPEFKSPVAFYETVSVLKSTYEEYYFIHPPPKYQGRALQSILQVYTI